MIKEFIKKWFGSSPDPLPICREPEEAIEELKELVDVLEDESLIEQVEHKPKPQEKVVHKIKNKKKKKR